jgi:predicted transglutaminase-like cysteine proteinase
MPIARALVVTAAVAALMPAPAGDAAAGAQEPGRLGFTIAASEPLIRSYQARFGDRARPRLEGWKRYAAKRKDEPLDEIQLLSEVNRTLNRLRFVDDLPHWGAVDYWATPAESVGSDGADCEDFSIAKFFLLKELGVPVSRLRMAYVKALTLDQAHMVLAYYPRPDAEPLVLDNLEDTVRPASERTDLIPVYSFNDEEVWIESQGRRGSPRQIRNWSLLLERLERELRLDRAGPA